MVCRTWQIADMRHYVDLCMAVDAAESEPSSRDVRPCVQDCQLAELRRPVLVNIYMVAQVCWKRVVSHDHRGHRRLHHVIAIALPIKANARLND